MPGLNDAVSATEVTDRNGNITVYELDSYGLPVEISEATNRDVRGTSVDPCSQRRESAGIARPS